MAQISLYADDETMDRLRARASERDLSVSKLVLEVVQGYLDSSWPEDYWELFGSAADDPSFEEPPELPAELDVAPEL